MPSPVRPPSSPPPLPVAPILRFIEPFATPAEEKRNLVRAVDDLGFNYKVVRVRYQYEGDDKFARDSYQPNVPVCGRIYEVDEDEWSSE